MIFISIVHGARGLFATCTLVPWGSGKHNSDPRQKQRFWARVKLLVLSKKNRIDKHNLVNTSRRMAMCVQRDREYTEWKRLSVLTPMHRDQQECTVKQIVLTSFHFGFTGSNVMLATECVGSMGTYVLCDKEIDWERLGLHVAKYHAGRQKTVFLWKMNAPANKSTSTPERTA